MNDRLYRSRSDRMLAGVAGGLADRFDLDPSFVRVGWAILTLLSGGIFLLIYIVMAIVVPEEPIGVGGGWPAAGSTGWSTSWSPPGDPAPGPVGPPAGGVPGTGSSAPAMGPTARVDPGPHPSSEPGFAAPGAGGSPPAGSGWPGDSGPLGRRAARDARRAARRAERGLSSDRPGAGGMIAGLILVGLGSYFLIRTFAPQFDLDRYWPAGLIVLGVLLIALSIQRSPGGTAPGP